MAKKIVVVDDDLGMQDAFQLLFDRAGYDATVLSDANTLLNGEQAVPDLYILDKQLSGVDGLDVCRFLNAQATTKAIPVIIISATPHLERLAGAACVADFIEKPFKRKELLELVARCLEARVT